MTLTHEPTLSTDNEYETLRQRLEIRDRQIHAVHQISEALFSQTDLDTLLSETLRVSLGSVDAHAGSLLLYDADRRKLIFEYVIGATQLIGQEIAPDHPTAKVSEVFRSGKSLLTADTRIQGHNSEIDRDTGYKTKNILTVPLRIGGGDSIGVLQVLNKQHGEPFDADDQAILEIVSSLAATTIVSNRLAKEAELAAVARAVGDLGHDIKNFLTPIETTVDTTIDAFIAPMYEDVDRMIAEWKSTAPEQAETLENITMPLRDWYPEVQTAVKDGCGDIREMVSEIADYIKGAQATNKEPGRVKEVIEDRLRRVAVIAQNRRVTLDTSGLEDVPEFPFDRRLLGRAMYNLVNNALGAISDAVKRKQIELRSFTIKVRASTHSDGVFPNGNYCLIEVEDDGPGVPAHVKPTLFTPGAVSTTPGGTGIGTRFVKSVADAHNGQVGVESEVGHGARFWMKLPLTETVSQTPAGGGS